MIVEVVRNSLGCGPFRYHPPKRKDGKQSEAEDCDDCGSGQTRFFFGSNCCSPTSLEEEKRPDIKRLMNATDCGRKGGIAPYLHQDDDSSRIVGGVLATENEFPWQVALMTRNDAWSGCGAILLSCDPVIVLSAAHCISKEAKADPSEIRLAFGAHMMVFNETLPPDKHEVRLDVEEIIVHPSYNPLFTLHVGISVRNNFDSVNLNEIENDIAIIKVKNGSSLPCSRRTIWPACLPNKNNEYGGWSRSIVTGWGRIGTREDPSTVLKKARIPIVTDQDCSQNFLEILPEIPDNKTSFWELADTKLCAGNIKKGEGICFVRNNSFTLPFLLPHLTTCRGTQEDL